MTQAELAARIGVTRQTVSAIELEKYSPSLEVAFKIARVFKVPLARLPVPHHQIIRSSF
jgi:putative transcriptional regulator